MAKRKAANKAKDDETKVNGAEATTSTTTTVTEKAKGGKKQKTAAEQKPPAQPFGDVEDMPRIARSVASLLAL